MIAARHRRRVVIGIVETTVGAVRRRCETRGITGDRRRLVDRRVVAVGIAAMVGVRPRRAVVATITARRRDTMTTGTIHAGRRRREIITTREIGATIDRPRAVRRREITTTIAEIRGAVVVGTIRAVRRQIAMVPRRLATAIVRTSSIPTVTTDSSSVQRDPTCDASKRRRALASTVFPIRRRWR